MKKLLDVLAAIGWGVIAYLAAEVAFGHSAHAQTPAGTLDPLREYRYTGEPPRRNAAGVIIRRSDVLAAYRRVHPCPSTGQHTGACPGWALNHVMPLACGGIDAVSNLMWMRVDAKRIVDSYERKISALAPPVPDTAACVNVIVP